MSKLFQDPVFTRGKFFLPIEKVDQERRIVWGVAQIEDAPDTQGDVVDFQASVDAFRNWAGNIREMHTAKAVGRCVKIIADEAKKRIFVGVHISEGAPDTWAKVLDGTLRGFSIGGSVIKAVKEKLASGAGTYRRIKQYVLDELSLVDSPANAHCLITAVQKRGNTLVPLADVLGVVPPGGKPMLRKRIADLNEIAKEAIAKGDSLIVIKQSDLEMPTDKSKPIVIKAGATGVAISKDEFSADGYGTDADPGAGDPTGEAGGGAEMEPMMGNLAKCHYGFAKAAGIDPDAHYQSATAEERAPEVDPSQPGAEGMPGAPAPIQAGRGMSPATVQSAIKKALDAAAAAHKTELEAMAARIDELTKGAGVTIQRKGGSGALADILSKGTTGGTPGADTDIGKALARCQKLYTEREEILAIMKSGGQLDQKQLIRKGDVSVELDKAIEGFKIVAGRTPSIDELKGPVAA